MEPITRKKECPFCGEPIEDYQEVCDSCAEQHEQDEQREFDEEREQAMEQETF